MALLLATLPILADHTYVTVADVGGADDAVGQADLTTLSFDGSHSGVYWVKWMWDRVSFSGANTGDACVLFDTDGDLLVDNSLCVQVGGSPAAAQSGYPKLFSCNESSEEKCGGSTALSTTATCAVTTATGPFNGSDSGSSDTQAECSIPLSDLSGSPVFTTVCSYPSAANGGNNDPSDCIVSPGTRFADLAVSVSNGTSGVVYGTTTTHTVTVTNRGPFDAPSTSVRVPATSGLTKTAVSCAAVSATCPSGLTVAQLESGVTIPTLNVSGTVTFTVSETVTATSGSVTASSTVTAPSGYMEPDTTNNTASDTDPVVGIIVTPTNGLTTTEAGGTATFTIVLISAPTGDVTIPLSSSNPAEGTVSHASVTFTTLDWNTPKTITVTGVDDALMDGNVAYTIVTGAATSTDGVYNALNPSDVSVTNLDNDTQADLSITKTDGGTSSTAGSNVTYTVTVSNAGPSAANDAVVIDPSVSGLTKTSVSCVAAGATCPTTLTVAALESPGLVIPALPSGGSITLTIGANVTATSGSVANTASANVPAGVTDPTPGNNSATDTNSVAVVTDLNVTVTDGTSSVAAGGATTYTMTVTNGGPSAASGATFATAAPAGVTFGAWTCTASGGAVCPANGSGNISAAVSIPSGGSLTFTVPATIGSGVSGSVVTTATVAAPSGATDPVPADNSASDTDTVTLAASTADLTVALTDGVTLVTPGGSTTYTLTVTNAGPSAISGATLISAAPAGVTYGPWSCSAAGGGTCPSGTSGDINGAIALPVGASITLTISASVSPSASGTIAATASVTLPGSVTDPNPANNAATDTDTVASMTPGADLTITKTNSVTSIAPGATTQYTVVVTNAGPDAVAGATVQDAGSSGLTIGGWSCTATGGAACPSAGGTGALAASITLPAGGQLTFVVTATVSLSASSTVTNTATVTAPSGVIDPNAGNNSASDQDAVATQRIGLAKQAGDVRYVAAGAFELPYTIRVQNIGTTAATNVQVTDSLTRSFSSGRPTISVVAGPTASGFNGATASQCVVNAAFDGAGDVNLLGGSATLAVGQGCEISFRVRVAYADVTAIPGGEQFNQANAVTRTSPTGATIASTVSDSGVDPAGPNSGAPGDTGGVADATPVRLVVPRVDITKAVVRVEQVDDTAFDLRYLLGVRNTGTAPARNVQVSDDLSAAFADGSPSITIVDGPALGIGDAVLTLADGASAFNGTTRTALLTGDDVLDPGQARSMAFTVRLRFPSASAIPSGRPLSNTAFVTTASVPGGPTLTSDASSDATGGTADPDASDEPSATVVRLTPRARVSIAKRAGAAVAEIGDSVPYVVQLINNGGGVLPATTVDDRMPLGFSYVEGSARLAATAGSAFSPIQPLIAGSTLTFVIPEQASGAAVLTYRLRVGVGARQGDGVNRAAVRGADGLASSESSARVVVRSGTFTEDACVVGRVFVDLDGNRMTGAQEPGIPGVRVVLEDGTALISDGSGNYGLCGLRAGTHAIKVDSLSLPDGARLVVASNRQAGDADTTFLDLKYGELRRADFIVGPPSNGATLTQVVNEIERRRTEVGQGLLPPDWPGGMNATTAAAGIPGQTSLAPATGSRSDRGVSAGGAVSLVTQPATRFDDTTGGLPASPGPVAFASRDALLGSGVVVGRIDLSLEMADAAPGTARVRLALFDAEGRPVQGSTQIRIELAGGVLATGRVSESGVHVDAVDGRAVIQVRPIESMREVWVRATSGLASATGTLTFAPQARPVMAVGVVEGLVALSRARGDALVPVGPSDVFENELEEFSRTLGDHGVVAGRGAMYLRGTVKGGYLMTLAYDSERPDRGVLFRDIQPDAFYPVYGDASAKIFDAQTSGRFYLRVEGGRGYLLYGDILTSAPAADTSGLGIYSRSLTGLQHRFERGRTSVNLFASRDTLRQVIDEIGGRGISGPYAVSHSNGVSGTEKVEIVTRDRNQPAVVLSAVRLARFTDYEFEPFSGRVLFRKPVPSMDERLNPMSVRITYEVDGGGDRHWVDGADGRVAVSRNLTLGGSFAQDHNPFAPFRVASVNAVVTAGPSTTVIVEGAETAGTVNSNPFNAQGAAGLAGLTGNVEGQAFRAELRHESTTLQARVYAGTSDPEFNNPSASFYGGRREAGARASWRVTPRVRLHGEAIESRDQLTGGERHGGLVAVESRFRRLTFETGLRRIAETATPAQPSTAGLIQPFGTRDVGGVGFAPSVGTVDPVTGMPIVSGGVTPLLGGRDASLPGRDLDATTIRTSVTATLNERWRAYGEAEQDVTDGDKHLAAAGGDYRLSSRGRLYGRHEFISSLDGIYALNGSARTQRTVVGLSTGYMKGGDVFSEYRLRDALSGREAQAAIGLRNAWTIAEGVRVSTGLERLNPVLGTTAPAASAASLGVEHVRSALTKATGRVEWRREGPSDSWLSTLGIARKISADWTILGKNYFQITMPSNAPSQRQDRLWFGTAFRDAATNRLNLLSRYELRLEDLPSSSLSPVGTDRRVHIVSSHAEYHPAPSWNLFGQYAGKWVREEMESLLPAYSAHLAAARATYDVTARLDVGALASVLWSGAEPRTRHAVGAEVGFRLLQNTWLSAGYNVTGFSDRDLRDVLRDGYTTRGSYVRLRVKFDEDLFVRR